MKASPAFLDYLKKRSPEEQAELVERIGDIAIERIALAIATVIPDKHVVEFTKLIKNGNEEKIGTFLDTHIPNMDTFVETVLADLRESLGDITSFSS